MAPWSACLRCKKCPSMLLWPPTFLLRFFSMLSTAKTCSPAAGSSIFRQERGSSSAPSPLLSVSDTVSSTPCKCIYFPPPRSTLHLPGCEAEPRLLLLAVIFLLPPPLSSLAVLHRETPSAESSGCSQKTLHANRRWRDVVVTGRGQRRWVVPAPRSGPVGNKCYHDLCHERRSK